MINRTAVILRPAAPFIEWARALDSSGDGPGTGDDQTVYLFPVVESREEVIEMLEEVHQSLFEYELEAWHTEESDWPAKRDFATFSKWFHIEFHSVIEDLSGEPLLHEEE